MQKNRSSYICLLKQSIQTNTTKVQNYYNKLSKKLFYTNLVVLILSFGVLSISIGGFIKNQNFSKLQTILPIQEISTNQTFDSTKNNSPAEYKTINYERPPASENFARNSGGPESSFQLSSVESEAEENVMEEELRFIEATSNPSYLPTMWAHMGKINNEYGFRRNPFGGRSYEFHPGIDIDGVKGDIVVAPANGTVNKAGWQGGYGNMIEIDHGNGLVTRYGHLSKIGVQIGDTIQRGQLIGLVGSTGRSTGPHLHYELRLNDKPINPRRFLPPEPTEIKALSAG